MKRKVVLIICLSVVVLISSSCDIDPYLNKRPVDYPNSVWVCDENDFYFIYYVDDHINDEYQSHFIMNAYTKTFIKFLWNQYDNGVIVYQIDKENGQENILFSGECTFYEHMFRVEITYFSDIISQLPEILIFEKIH